MRTVKPTKAGLAKISIPHDKQTEYLIYGVPNVRIRVGATGKLGFSLLNRVDGKMRRISMEVHDHSRNGILDAMLRAQGQAEVKASLGDKTLRAIGEKIIEESNIAEATRKNRMGHLEHLVRVFDNKLTDDAGHIFDAHRRLTREEGPVAANNCIRTYRRIINVAGAAYNVKLTWPTQKIATLKMWNEERPRESRAEFKQLPEIWSAAFDMPEPWGRLLQFYLLTGLRKQEAITGRVIDDDFVVEDTKNRKTHRLPMTPQMRLLTEKPWVSASTGKPVQDGRGATEALEKLTGIHLTRHDLRRTFAAIANDVGATDHTIKMLMNHKKVDVTGNYMGRNRDTMEVNLLKIAERYAELTQAPERPVDDAERLQRELSEKRKKAETVTITLGGLQAGLKATVKPRKKLPVRKKARK